MSEYLKGIIFYLATSFGLAAVGFVLGVIKGKLSGSWQVPSIRHWWTSFCLALPFISFAWMIESMWENHFERLRASWAVEPFSLGLVIGLAMLLSSGLVVAMVQLWRTWNAERRSRKQELL